MPEREPAMKTEIMAVVITYQINHDGRLIRFKYDYFTPKAKMMACSYTSPGRITGEG